MIHNSKRNHTKEAQPDSTTRAELEARFGQVWDTKELARDFIVTSIIGRTLVVRRKAGDVVGTLTIQERPWLYFDFTPYEENC